MDKKLGRIETEHESFHLSRTQLTVMSIDIKMNVFVKKDRICFHLTAYRVCICLTLNNFHRLGTCMKCASKLQNENSVHIYQHI